MDRRLDGLDEKFDLLSAQTANAVTTLSDKLDSMNEKLDDNIVARYEIDFILFRREDPHLKKCEGGTPVSRWGMNRLRTRDGFSHLNCPTDWISSVFQNTPFTLLQSKEQMFAYLRIK